MGRGIEDFESYTFRLFKRTHTGGFLSGVASILGTENTDVIYNYDTTSQEADRISVRSDWMQVGNDLRQAIDTYAGTGEASAV